LFGKILNPILLLDLAINGNLRIHQSPKGSFMYCRTLIFLFALLNGSLFAATTLQFSVPFTGSIASNFADQFGNTSPTNPMQWGIVIDTGGNGFAGMGQAYTEFAPGPSTSGFLQFGGVASDDFFLTSGFTMGDTSALFESGFTAPGGPGTIGDIVVNYTGGVAPGQSYGIIWFSTNSSGANDYYGFLNLGAVLPADNLPAFDASAPFAGADPIRSASFQFQAIPEPSRALLLGLAGMIGLMRRRRRKA
jgi:hypothetical protein